MLHYLIPSAMFLCMFAFGGLSEECIYVSTETCSARFEYGALVTLHDTFGNTWVHAPTSINGAGVYTDTSTYLLRESSLPNSSLTGTHVYFSVTTDLNTHDLLINVNGRIASGGVTGIAWTIEKIPLEYSLIIPAHSGIRLTRDTPGCRLSFNYPMEWEAQFIVIEGPSGGFFVFAEDAEGQFKKLEIDREEDGWRLGFIAHPYAPYETKTACTSPIWRLNVYQGDWRVAAKRYRSWLESTYDLVPIKSQQPAWVRDIRNCLITPIDSSLLPLLSEKLDASQTLLYVYDWRAQGYDRMYPDYENPISGFEEYLEQAKRLGFRIMLHVNYLGCDYQHPLYEEFKSFQCRTPYGSHTPDEWYWPHSDPPIRFAYITPACQVWRSLLVEKFIGLCTRYAVDALHLDQTLLIYNDYNGVIDGMNMLQGNLALHQELRKALPHIALSGEGLNEITFRHEAFAQRHVRGLYHAEGNYNLEEIEMAHPICAYLFGNYTTLYGYLGMAPPSKPNLYAAWKKAYQRWGVIPTLTRGQVSLHAPSGFIDQFFTEARFWTDNRIVHNMEGTWPHCVDFPLKTVSNEETFYTRNMGLVYKKREVIRTLHGVASAELPGSIFNWRGYNRSQIIGLDPSCFYPYVPNERNFAQLHVSTLPDGVVLSGVVEGPNWAVIRTRAPINRDLYLGELLKDAVCGSTPTNGSGYECPCNFDGPDGASFKAAGNILHAHPPYLIPDSGTVFARYTIDLPMAADSLVSRVALATGARQNENTSDGVIFRVLVSNGEQSLLYEHFCISEIPEDVSFDLSSFAGEKITVELQINAGKNNDPSFDWARWYSPRIVCKTKQLGNLSITGWSLTGMAVTSHGVQAVLGNTPQSLLTAFPGTIYLLKTSPVHKLDQACDLLKYPFFVTYENEIGLTDYPPDYACARIKENRVAGTVLQGFFAHPPDSGKTMLHFPVVIGENLTEFSCNVGLLDGAAKSNGVIFSIEVNGTEVARQYVRGGAWQKISASLIPWVGQPVVLALITDANDNNFYDWACWGF